jgi:hypothetical protein
VQSLRVSAQVLITSSFQLTINYVLSAHCYTMRFIGPVAHITIAPRARSVCVCAYVFLRNAGAVKAKNNRVAPCAPVMSHFHSHKGAALLGPARRMCVCVI